MDQERMARKFVSESRLHTILRRQAPDKWGSKYEAAIFATREEAPRISRPCTIQDSGLGRRVHLLSGPEQAIFFLARYHPNVVDIQEQRMLPMQPTEHPWTGRPEAAALELPGFQGTLDVAEQMGDINRHASFVRKGSREHVPFPYIGDLLLFRNDDGPYCINWTCKDRLSSFGERRPDDPIPKNAAHAAEWALFRHSLERRTYEDAGIRTQQCVRTDLPGPLQTNLRNTYLNSLYPEPYPKDRRDEIVRSFQDGMNAGTPACQVVRRLSGGDPVAIEDIRTVLMQAIYRRRLRVDLFDVIDLSMPLRPERRDVLDVYAHWFAR